MKRFIVRIALLLLAPCTDMMAQLPFRVMSYNVENLFDTSDNPETADEEFLPAGIRHWTPRRYWHKLRQLAKVITAAGEWQMPALVGLCEVENDSVLIHLTRRSPLANMPIGIDSAQRSALTPPNNRHRQYPTIGIDSTQRSVSTDTRYAFASIPSADRRGLTLALLYQPKRFVYIGHAAIPVRFSGDRHKHTRDLMHAWGRIETGDTLDVFVCHFPSRYGGKQRSERDRIDAARTLRNAADSLLRTRRTPLLLLMGDFNDTPKEESIQTIVRSGNYRNLFGHPPRGEVRGSHKYQARWSQLDQVIIGGRLTDSDSPMRLRQGSARIFAPGFLLTEDKSWQGIRPLRTYHGFKYEGGFSDHLPLIVDFWLHLPTQN